MKYIKWNKMASMYWPGSFKIVLIHFMRVKGNSESISNAQGYKVDKKQLWNFISNVKMIMF